MTPEVAEFRLAHSRDAGWRAFTSEDALRLAGLGLAGRIPPQHLELLELDGWASYDDGALWIADPDELAPVSGHWVEGTPLFRTAMGNLFIWDGAMVRYADVHYGLVGVIAIEASFLYNDVLVRKRSVNTFLDPKLLRRAKKEAGALAPNEMYFWDPALALGGDPTTAKLSRGNVIEALASLARSTPVIRR